MKGILFCFFCLFGWTEMLAQVTPPAKEVTSYYQTWFSFNSTFRLSKRWGAVGDVHIRKDQFISQDFFYFLRVGGVYWIADKYPVIAGVAHLWLAPQKGNDTWGNENRVYQQWSAVAHLDKVSVLHRIRLEERWRDKIVNDEVVGTKQFSSRLRYLASFEIKVFENPMRPKLVVSDEILVQFGKSIVYNTFDQNRLFLGVKVPLNPKVSFDVGYMNILQQKPMGYQYDLSHVFRLFFYYNLDRSNAKAEGDSQDNSE